MGYWFGHYIEQRSFLVIRTEAVGESFVDIGPSLGPSYEGSSLPRRAYMENPWHCSDPFSNTAHPAIDRAIAEWDAIAGWAVLFTNGANDRPIHQSGWRPQ